MSLDFNLDVALDKTFSFDQGDQDLDSSGLRLKFEQGRTYRLSMVIFPSTNGKTDPTKPPRWWATTRYYHEGIRQFVEYTEDHRKFLTGANKPRNYAATIVVMHPVDAKGKIDMGRMATDTQVKYLLVDKTKYADIKNLQDEFPFGSNDLVVTCTDTQFQKITVRTTQKNMFLECLQKAQTDPNSPIAGVVTALVSRIKQVGERLNGSELANRYSVAEIENRLRGALASPGRSMAGAAAAPAVSNEDIDDLLGKI